MITRDDWLEAVNAAMVKPVPESDALTLLEIAAMLNLSPTQTKRRMRVLVAAGGATRTKKAIRRTDGQVVDVAAYRLNKP